MPTFRDKLRSSVIKARVFIGGHNSELLGKAEATSLSLIAVSSRSVDN